MAEGKIIKALSGFYYVQHEEGITQCRGRGVFRKNKITPLVGDQVIFQADNPSEGYVLEVFERKNELVRPPIANVDQAILVFSAVEPDFNPGLLDRFLVLIEFHNITPIICISKMDLVDDKMRETVESYANDYRAMGYDVIFTSTIASDSIDILKPLLEGCVSVVAGQSGVGKSSILNVLRPDLALKTNDISTHLGRGKHTTRHVELIEVGSGLVADTPGFSSLDFIDIEVEDLTHCFPELKEESQYCKFRGCTHLSEPKCAVKTAVEEGKITRYRYENYKQFVEEIRERKPRY
ncbi:ribosome small subunit-dependent GTPase A [Bacillus sp. DX1.1]|uniref:ribosome small subunit-dependent GTPase A n=1 Tax=unclassified Bacillus (in: firmicutes) TaxID=185979 RepID=UPI002570017C|nr:MULTISPECIES: ribosome small subunit-dependent GTPase A [unclassified Bacillus (in: firmicutes)]MDM5156049.1 ribosome small subunit-dependent GTPase A [Bacillus sp. DX1.1]WJE80338.1 ribosome small subunit-dependent GTPase A [Bacillus sp. DX3.1]